MKYKITYKSQLWQYLTQPDYIKLLGKILVFNQGSRSCLDFIPSHNRPTFLWFWDSFYGHTTHKINLPVLYKDRYLHFFVIDPKDDPRIVAMQGIKSFYALCKHFVNVKFDKSKSDPPILRSWDIFVPNLVFDFEDEYNNEAVIIFPENLKGKRVRFFNEHNIPLNFFEIPEFMDLLPELRECKSTYGSFMKILSKIKK